MCVGCVCVGCLVVWLLQTTKEIVLLSLLLGRNCTMRGGGGRTDVVIRQSRNKGVRVGGGERVLEYIEWWGVASRPPSERSPPHSPDSLDGRWTLRIRGGARGRQQERGHTSSHAKQCLVCCQQHAGSLHPLVGP